MKKFLILAAGIACLFLQSCNVTRVVTTEAKSLQRGDTTIHITTRTVESYDASKKTF